MRIRQIGVLLGALAVTTSGCSMLKPEAAHTTMVTGDTTLQSPTTKATPKPSPSSSKPTPTKTPKPIVWTDLAVTKQGLSYKVPSDWQIIHPHNPSEAELKAQAAKDGSSVADARAKLKKASDTDISAFAKPKDEAGTIFTFDQANPSMGAFLPDEQGMANLINAMNDGKMTKYEKQKTACGETHIGYLTTKRRGKEVKGLALTCINPADRRSTTVAVIDSELHTPKFDEDFIKGIKTLDQSTN